MAEHVTKYQEHFEGYTIEFYQELGSWTGCALETLKTVNPIKRCSLHSAGEVVRRVKQSIIEQENLAEIEYRTYSIEYNTHPDSGIEYFVYDNKVGKLRETVRGDSAEQAITYAKIYVDTQLRLQKAEVVAMNGLHNWLSK